MLKSLYFIAIVPPDEIQMQVQEFQKLMALRYLSKHALRSPPHITLIPPFYCSDSRYTELNEDMIGWLLHKDPIPIRLLNFGCFKPRVIFVDIVTNPALIILQNELKERLKNKWQIGSDRWQAFHPHLTIAFKDLKVPQFYDAWQDFVLRSFSAQFLCDAVYLLKYTTKRWEIIDRLAMKINSP